MPGHEPPTQDKSGLDWRFVITFIATLIPTIATVAYMSGQQTNKTEQLQRNLEETSSRLGQRLSQNIDDLRGQINQGRIIDEKQLDQLAKRIDNDEKRQESLMQITIQSQAYIEGLVRTIQQMQQSQLPPRSPQPGERR